MRIRKHLRRQLAKKIKHPLRSLHQQLNRRQLMMYKRSRMNQKHQKNLQLRHRLKNNPQLSHRLTNNPQLPHRLTNNPQLPHRLTNNPQLLRRSKKRQKTKNLISLVNLRKQKQLKHQLKNLSQMNRHLLHQLRRQKLRKQLNQPLQNKLKKSQKSLHLPALLKHQLLNQLRSHIIQKTFPCITNFHYHLTQNPIKRFHTRTNLKVPWKCILSLLILRLCR